MIPNLLPFILLIKVKINILKLLNALSLGMFLAEYDSIGTYNDLISNILIKKSYYFDKFLNQGCLTYLFIDFL